MLPEVGLEPTTPGTLVRHSSHLSYPGGPILTTTCRLYTSPPFLFRADQALQNTGRLSASSQDDLFQCMDPSTNMQFRHHCRETRGKSATRGGARTQDPGTLVGHSNHLSYPGGTVQTTTCRLHKQQVSQISIPGVAYNE